MEDDDLETCIRKAKDFVDAQNFQKAYEVFNEALKKYPTNSELRNGLRNMQENVLERISSKPVVTFLSTNLRELPGDSVILNAEEERINRWLETADDNVAINEDFQDHSIKEANTALELYKRGEINRARQLICSGSESHENDVDIVMKSLFDATLYKECAYLMTSLPHKKISPSAWMLGAKAANELGLPTTAEHWIRKVDESDDCNDEERSEAIELFLKIRKARLFNEKDTEAIVDIKLTEEGRMVTSSCKMDTHSVVFREPPALLSPVLDADYGDIPACSHCAKCLISAEQFFGVKLLKGHKLLKDAVTRFWTNRTPLKCDHCAVDLYCSEKCKLDSWKNYHRLLCPSVSKHTAKLYDICNQFKKALCGGSNKLEGWWFDNFSPVLLARLWASILCDAGRDAESSHKEEISDVDLAMSNNKYASFQVCSLGGITKRIPKMYDLMVKIFTKADRISQYEITPQEFNYRYSQINRNIQAFSDPTHPYFEFRKHIDSMPEMQNLRKVLPNSIKEAVFTGLFRIQSSLNHSCANNVEIISGNANETPGIHVISKRPIREGEELLTSYVDTSLNRQQRRGFLYQTYHFWCECPRCLFEGDDSDTCTQCRREAEEERGFPACGRCHKAWYCSKACQKEAWKKGHKEICLY